MNNLRLLKANEIDVRVGTINEKGATLLLYKDARVDMNILDEARVKWKRSHELINGNLFCTISVWDNEIHEWISRQDVGVESNTEKEKGQASDAFKRAGFNFGIGRELYTAPFIWVNATDYNGYIKNGKPATYDKFVVTSIGYDDNKEINSLVIKNTKTSKVVFTFGSKRETVNEVRDRKEELSEGPSPMGETPAQTLTRAKTEINKAMEEAGYTSVLQKQTFVTMVLRKATIDSLDDAHEVMDAIENGQ